MDIKTHPTLKNGLLGYWTLDAGAQDVSGNARHGTPEGPPSLVQGKLRTCYRLNGTSQAIDLTNNMALAPTTGITVACWVKIEGAAARQWQDPISRFYYGWNAPVGESGLCYVLQFDRTAKTWSWSLGTGTSSTGVTVTNDTEGSWVFLVGTWNGTTIRLYLNGAEVGTPAAFAGPLNQESSLRTLIGSRMGDGYLPATRRFDYMNGLVDDVGIWNRALITGEIADLYQGGIGITWNGTFNSIGAHPTLPTGLIAYYKLDGNANDAHTNALHGTAVGVPTWPTAAGSCRLRQALQINGTTQFVWIADNALFESTTGLSVSGWFWIDSTGSDWQVLVSKYFWGSPWSNKSWELDFQLSTNTLRAYVVWGPTSGNIWTVTKGSLSTLKNAWNHLAFTYDKANLVLYVNGFEVARTTGCSGNPQDAPISIYLGSYWDQDSGGRFYSKGYYDEIAIAARGWTAAEVLALYHTGYPLRYAEVPATDLVAIAAHTISDFVGSATIPAGMDYERSSHPLARARDVADLSLTGGICLPQDPEIIYLENRLLPAGSVPIAATRSTHPAHPQNVGTASGIYIKRRS